MTTGIRERRRVQTQAEISRAAVDLATRHGFGNITVEEIAEAAGVSPRTFFNYFSSKREAVLTWAPSLDPDSVHRFVQGRDRGLLDGLRSLLLGYAATAERRRGEMQRMQRLIAANPELGPHVREVFREFEASIAQAVARRTGTAAQSREPRMAAAVATTLLRVAFTEWLQAEEQSALTDILDEVFASMDTLSSHSPMPTPHGDHT